MNKEHSNIYVDIFYIKPYENLYIHIIYIYTYMCIAIYK